TTSKLSFRIGKVAIGELPIPMPLRNARGAHTRGVPKFVRLSNAGPRARLFLDGVVDAEGNPVSNTGNQLILDPTVVPSGALLRSPPYAIPFDIVNGTAFVDAPLPIQSQPDTPVTVQTLGASVLDPDGQPFGVLGFHLKPARQTPVPQLAPTPGGTP